MFAALVWRIGTGPFLDGLRAVDASSLAVATSIGLVTTVCCVWRWRLVARSLHVDVSMREGIASYYRSQFLNTVLPGGVLGDVHRAVRCSSDVGDAVGMRTVAWERSVGQLVQAVLTVIILVVLPSPVRSAMPIVVSLAVTGFVFGMLVFRSGATGGSSWWARTGDTLRADVRGGLLTARTLPALVTASAIVMAGHVATFLVAARTAGATGPVTQMVPLALLVLLAMALPVNIGGWGPREGVSAWAFAMVGLGASRGAATAVVYGVMVMAATVPGLVVLIAQSADRSIARAVPLDPVRRPLATAALEKGGSRD